ncbi:uncharacterized protein LOC106466227 [Limulus polyphemus]|uniref:Uncharacterized protein LOC106466227 n=1 Tax=Limulus polyphemus TaxID=6850 RepID=A0ABM1T205_LIMPO|nr:uncharacterized protein LOC106466227 [Limulus polyphemus]
MTLNFTQSHCQTEERVFMLGSSISPNLYEYTSGPNLSYCVKHCRQDERCHAVAFTRSVGEDVDCGLMGEFQQTRGKWALPGNHRMLSGTTYYLQTLCLKEVCEMLLAREWVPGKELIGYDHKVIHSVSKHECLQACIKEGNFECKSVEYHNFTGECHLSHSSRIDRPELFQKTESSINYLDNYCSHSPDFINSNTSKIVVLGKVDALHNLIGHQKVSTDGCGGLCFQNHLFSCQSFLFGHGILDTYCGVILVNNDEIPRIPRISETTRSPDNQETSGISNTSYRKFNGCDPVDVHFELMSGIYLDIVAYKSSNETTPEKCLNACRADAICHSVNIDYRKMACYFNKNILDSSTEDFLKNNGSFNYFKKICLSGASKCKRQWAFERVKGKMLVGYAHEKLIAQVKSLEECQTACLLQQNIVCRSAEFDPKKKECQLSSYNRFTTTDKSIELQPSEQGVDYLENNCLKVSVDCHPFFMNVTVSTNVVFRGKIYTQGRDTTCFVDVHESLQFTLPVLLNGSQCGTVNQAEGKFSNVLIIQNNDNVVTARDKAVGVQCTFQVGNKTGGTELNISQLNPTDRKRGKPPLPVLSLHIMDIQGRERKTFSIGELLKLQVRMSDDDTYGIFLRNLIAKDPAGANNLTLIDNSGCPVEMKMMREVRTVDEKSKFLESYLEAFTFMGSNIIELEADVETCLERCKPVLCQIPTGRSEDDMETVYSYGRRKRRELDENTYGDVLSIVRLSKSVGIRAPEFGVRDPSTKNVKYARPITAPPLTASNEFDLKQPTDGDVFCFDPMLAAVLGVFILVLEISGITACIVTSLQKNRCRKEQDSYYSVYSDGKTESSGLTTLF